jgi:TRAP-type C4-dicarboxylate transport system permease small subunit
MDRISRLLNTVVKHMAGFLTGAMAVLVFLQVLFRYVLDAPLDWSEEMSTFAFAWMALLGASVGLRYDEHPRLDIVFARLPPRVQKITKMFINFSILFMLIILFVYGLKLTLAMKMQSTAALGYSVSFVYMVLPVSAFIMLIHVVVQTVELLKPRSVEG